MTKIENTGSTKSGRPFMKGGSGCQREGADRLVAVEWVGV